MRNLILIALLAPACLAQAAGDQTQEKKSAIEEYWSAQDRWLDETRKALLEGTTVPFQRFDDLFNDDFYGRRFDPFQEMEQLQRRMHAMLGESQQRLFNRSWNDWFDSRIGLTDIHTETKTTKDEVILSFRIPGLNADSLSININDNRIRVSYDAKNIQDKKDEKGKAYFKSESVQHFEKVMPIPADADPVKNRIVHEGDVVKVIFEKRREKGLKF
jgi:HSP20 family molecular chaperone IbpA